MTNVALCPQPDALNLISLCTGGGGLDRAVELAIPAARPIVCVERESFSVASLVAQIENGLMAPAAVWSNVRTFSGRRFRGLVDGLIGGIPCQGHSLAGRRQGSLDERDLWSPARRIIAQARPWFVLIENVGGMLSAGADEVPGAERVRRDLRKLGYSVTLVIVRADQMGLPHERLRVFILGVAEWFVADAGWAGRQQVSGSAPGDEGSHEGRTPANDHLASGSGKGLADASCVGRRGEGHTCKHAGRLPSPGGCELGHSADRKPQVCEGDDRFEEERSAVGRRAIEPARTGTDGRDRDGEDAAGNGGIGPSASDRGVDGRHALDDASGSDGRLHPRSRSEGERAPDARGAGQVVHALGGGRSGQPEGALGGPIGRVAEQQPSPVRDEQRLADGHGAEPTPQRRDPGQMRGLSEGEGGPDHGAALPRGGRPFLRPPGPGDFNAWHHVAFVAPELLPAVSRYDRLRLEMGTQGFVAHGDPSSGAWMDAQTGARVHSSVLQAATERAFRGVADVMAPRIDELRMLGNGVVDAQGALAVRIGAHDLAARGSPGAALLVRMMGEA